ncbi:hypothetical protein EPUS_07099 [Endocarpon pusillum Z07020]|uniref:NmrA-like domain-containing protein n=1 Tax=Endocarpon pusillum (strain Z07020 / HMAS-L-300199) TaxID=1263415 RepID=U1HR88_ENDPU|nr:uncharacterized protein EPUS_07099 [Endocarpon pusillum Z07020]ERF73005.1 hypothetical protein EPUS_07099 [Endocarpon pusillum Z07020]
MSSITKVALAGATGNLGPAILDGLLNAGFKVTVLTRSSSTHSFPPSVTAISVDYNSLDSLTNALKGIEAVVSALPYTGNPADVTTNLRLVEAAAKAHVKRFIPSEFGSDTLNEKARTLPVFAGKVAVQDALKKEAATGGMTYTVVCTGPFLDWGIMVGFIMNLKGKSISLWDGGDRVFSATSLQAIGKATAGVLKQLEQTKNRAVYVHETATTLKKLATMGKHATGADGWQENVVSMDEQLEMAWAELKKDQPNPDNFAYNFIKASIWGEGFGGHFERLDNKLLGIKEMGDAELQDLVNSLATK